MKSARFPITRCDEALIDAGRLPGHAQLIDSYLLALALADGGQLASFDRRLMVDAVRGGAGAVPGACT